MVICAGKATNKAARPTRAGLNKLLPNPPNDIFATPIAKKAPIMIIHAGRLEGRLNASSKPVRMAEPSSTVLRCCFRTYLLIAHSKNKQDATLVVVTTTEPSPKKKNDTRSAGIKAMMTPYILRSTVSVPWACGDNETINFPILFLSISISDNSHYSAFTQSDIV